MNQPIRLCAAYLMTSSLYLHGAGKMQVLDFVLAMVKAQTDDKVVLVSNYTQTLDMFEKLSRLRGYVIVAEMGCSSVVAHRAAVLVPVTAISFQLKHRRSLAAIELPCKGSYFLICFRLTHQC